MLANEGAPSAPPRKSNDSRAGSQEKVSWSDPPSSRVLGAVAAVEQLDAAEKSRFAHIIADRWKHSFTAPVGAEGAGP